MTEREIIVRLGLMIDTATRDLEDLQRLGTIDGETHQIANDSLRVVTVALANIPKR